MSLVDLEERAHRMHIDLTGTAQLRGGVASLDELIDLLEIVHTLIKLQMAEPSSNPPEQTRGKP